jgi:hypothetical protein
METSVCQLEDDFAVVMADYPLMPPKKPGQEH